MKEKYCHSIENLVNYFCDGIAIYVITEFKSSVMLNVFDPESFDKLSTFTIRTKIHGYSEPCVDNENIYFGTPSNWILGFDKFSGERVYSSDLGTMTVVYQDDNNLYALCGLPISHNMKVDINSFCVCVVDKSSGKKIIQSQTMTGELIQMSFLDDFIMVSVGNNVYKYNKSCEVQNVGKLNSSFQYSPTITDKYVCCASAIGTMEIFNKTDMSKHMNVLVAKNNSAPIRAFNDKVYWFTGKSLHAVRLDNGAVTKSCQTPFAIESSPVLNNDKLYVSDQKGNLLSYDIKRKKLHFIKLSDEKLSKPVIVDNNILVASNKGLHYVEV